MEIEEKIYDEQELESFFNELIKRKRFDANEGGLQACGVISKDKARFKVTEDDGVEPHMYSNFTLANNIATGNIKRYRGANFSKFKDIQKICCEWLELRITDSDELLLAFHSYRDLNSYQLKIIKEFLRIVATPKVQEAYKEIKIGISGNNISIPFDTSLAVARMKIAQSAKNIK